MITIEQRFWAKVKLCKHGVACQYDDCHWWWLGAWTGEKDKSYGRFHIRYENNRRIFITAHVFMWTLFNGPVPVGEVIRHTCDLYPCVRLFHLINGTPHENSDDMVYRGRHPRIKLNAELVRYIFTLRAQGHSYLYIQNEVHISASVIYSIIYRQSWNHVYIEPWLEQAAQKIKRVYTQHILIKE